MTRRAGGHHRRAGLADQRADRVFRYLVMGRGWSMEEAAITVPTLSARHLRTVCQDLDTMTAWTRPALRRRGEVKR